MCLRLTKPLGSTLDMVQVHNGNLQQILRQRQYGSKSDNIAVCFNVVRMYTSLFIRSTLFGTVVCEYICLYRYNHNKHDIMVFRKKLHVGSRYTW